MKLKISKWLNNHQAPCVLMIDDVSDAYINKYSDEKLNDWGYLCDGPNSSFTYLKENLLNKYPQIKITFFVPYARHAVIKEQGQYPVIKYGLGERIEYSEFLKRLIKYGYEISHHGSDHGRYSGDKWAQEWELFDSVCNGVKQTELGVELFREHLGVSITGGKYCGYISIANSSQIIEQCGFLYW